MPEPASHAVFLSYASEDAAPVRRIADSLRAAGVEVWLDESELGGGDAWDKKIRSQIGDRFSSRRIRWRCCQIGRAHV